MSFGVPVTPEDSSSKHYNTKKDVKVFNAKITRNTFDDNFDDQVKDLMIRNFGHMIDILDFNISCDICGKESKERRDFLRTLCDKCHNYYDYCVHHETPNKCPLKECQKH